MDLFEWQPPAPQYNTPDMHRRNDDHQTAIDASERVAKFCKTELQTAVYEALIKYGPMTDGELERLDVFAHYSPSTVRKRRSELYQEGRVAKTDARRDGMSVWMAVR